MEIAGDPAAPPFFAPGRWDVLDWLTAVGLPLALIALFLARKQASDTATVAKNIERVANDTRALSRETERLARSTEESVTRTEQHLADNHLLILIPRLLHLRRELDSAVRSDESDLAIRSLSDWLEVSSEVQEILTQRGPEHDKLAHSLESLSLGVGQAKDELIETKSPVADATRDVRSDMGDICNRAGRIVGGMKAFAGSTDEEKQ